MKQISSEITGVVERAREASSSTGLQRGESGSAATTDQTRAWLIGRNPAEVDQALLTSLRSSLGVEVEPEFEWRFPKDKPAYRVPGRVHVAGPVENLPAARQKTEAACTPPTTEDAENWLAALQVATAGAKRSEQGTMLALSLYAAALKRYPADVAMRACADLATTANWFPTLAELIARCDALGGPRLAIRNALNR